MLKAGIGSEMIALWLGHESPDTTQIYLEADLSMTYSPLIEQHGWIAGESESLTVWKGNDAGFGGVIPLFSGDY